MSSKNQVVDLITPPGSPTIHREYSCHCCNSGDVHDSDCVLLLNMQDTSSKKEKEVVELLSDVEDEGEVSPYKDALRTFVSPGNPDCVVRDDVDDDLTVYSSSTVQIQGVYEDPSASDASSESWSGSDSDSSDEETASVYKEDSDASVSAGSELSDLSDDDDLSYSSDSEGEEKVWSTSCVKRRRKRTVDSSDSSDRSERKSRKSMRFGGLEVAVPVLAEEEPLEKLLRGKMSGRWWDSDRDRVLDIDLDWYLENRDKIVKIENSRLDPPSELIWDKYSLDYKVRYYMLSRIRAFEALWEETFEKDLEM